MNSRIKQFFPWVLKKGNSENLLFPWSPNICALPWNLAPYDMCAEINLDDLVAVSINIKLKRFIQMSVCLTTELIFLPHFLKVVGCILCDFCADGRLSTEWRQIAHFITLTPHSSNSLPLFQCCLRFRNLPLPEVLCLKFIYASSDTDFGQFQMEWVRIKKQI